MLLTGSGDELCGPVSAPISSSGLSPTTAFPVFVYSKFMKRPTPCTSPLLQCAYSTPPPLLHVPFQFLIYCSVFVLFCFVLQFLFCFWVSVHPEGYAGLSQGWLWEYCMPLICSPVGLLDVSQAGLELVSGGAGALLFSQCNVAWRSFVQAGGSGCRSFASSWFFFSAKCGSSISVKF
jgi:hypothetical protein